MALLLGLWYANNTRIEVFVVGGLPQAYAVKIDGHSLWLEPGVPQRVELSAWKTFRVEADFGKLSESYESDLDPLSLNVTSSRTAVLNPDRLATLVRDRKSYSPEGAAREPEEIREVGRVSGQAIHHFYDLGSSAFEAFPVALGKPTKHTKLDRSVDRLRVDLAALDQLPALPRRGNPRRAVAAERQMRRYLELIEMDESEKRSWLASFPAPFFAAHAAAELERHPPAIEWHRTYQRLPDHAGHEAELTAEYRRRQEAHPGDSEWLYLLAEAIADPQVARRKLEQAASLAQVSPWVFHGLAWSELQSGRFDAALAFNRRSRESAPEEPEFRRLGTLLALATGDLRTAAGGGDLDPLVHAALLASLGVVEAAPGVAPPPSDEGGTVQARWERDSFVAAASCRPRGLACFERQLAGLDSSQARFWLGLIRRDEQLATDHFPAESPLESHLLMAVVFPEDGYHRGKAADLLAAQGFAAATAARALRGESYRREELMAASLPLERKPAILYLAGRRAADAEMLELARKLSFLPLPGQLLLAREVQGTVS